jgi:cbb3-type cytochrome oxidase subunit 3
VLRELVTAPVAAGGFTGFLLIRGYIFAAAVTTLFLLIALVQAWMYVPRARAAARLEQRHLSR